jgi:hypothetical protein
MGTWSTAAPLPQPRAEHAVIGLDGKIYAIAGGIPKVDGTGMQNNGASTLVDKPRQNFRYVYGLGSRP